MSPFYSNTRRIPLSTIINASLYFVEFLSRSFVDSSKAVLLLLINLISPLSPSSAARF
jgi:hypothetical protein